MQPHGDGKDEGFCMSRRVVGNAASVMAVQAGSYILPLINVPYLLRVIGPEHYGLIAFSQAVMAYFVTLNDYGFNLSATRELALRRNDPVLRSELYSAVMAIKCSLCVLSFIILCALVYFVPRFHSNGSIFFASFGIVVGTMMFPQWFFQGIEKMYWISMVNLTANVIFTAGIYLLVRHSSDYLMAAIVQAAGKVLAGILGLIILFSTEHVKLSIPTLVQVRHRLYDGWHLFMSSAAATLYTSSNAVVLGFVCGMTEVGYFSAAYKIFAAGQGIVSPMCQAIYPHVCSLAHESRERAVNYLRKAMVVIGGLTFSGGLLVLLLAPVIVRIAMGSKYMASVPVLELMAMTPFACALNNIYGTQGMLNFGMKPQFSRIIVFSAFFNILILVPLCYWFKAPGAAASALLTETVVTLTMALMLHGRGIDLLPRLSDMRGQVASVSFVSLRKAMGR
jgi:PST family polysaccharide transporter